MFLAMQTPLNLLVCVGKHQNLSVRLEIMSRKVLWDVYSLVVKLFCWLNMCGKFAKA